MKEMQQHTSFKAKLPTSTSTSNEDFEYVDVNYRNDVQVESADISSFLRETKTYIQENVTCHQLFMCIRLPYLL